MGKISKNLILMVDEMFLQKYAQYQGGEYIGVNKDGKLYKGIVAFMVVGLKQSVPYVIQVIQMSVNGTWLSHQMERNVKVLAETGFSVRAIVSDNHSSMPVQI